ncbi:MAG: hypothetical protein BWX86_01906 [Verrucomicrobia bacterium ADurb.Bin122]|nr:MAG: hypothetical protein BWX86_01906 [Verrucomicrobia bacterium ADurb.Bin122]
MVRLVIEHDDVFQAHEVRHDALDHLAFRFERVEVVTAPPLEQRASAGGEFDTLPQLERVEIRDDEFRALEVFQHLLRNQLAMRVVTVGIVWLENAQAVFDG